MARFASVRAERALAAAQVLTVPQEVESSAVVRLVPAARQGSSSPDSAGPG